MLPIPKHPRIRHLGFLSDEDKFDALAAADVLIMPSHVREPVDGRARSVGDGQAGAGQRRAATCCAASAFAATAGLYYETSRSSPRRCTQLEASGPLGAVLGRNGREFFRRHYTWPVIERKYLDMFDRLKRETRAPPMEPLPGWFARRTRGSSGRRAKWSTARLPVADR